MLVYLNCMYMYVCMYLFRVKLKYRLYKFFICVAFMKVILNNHIDHHDCVIAIDRCSLSNSFIQYIRTYLDNISDFRGGMTSWGKPIPRLQKWYGDKYFGQHWKDQDNERWKPCQYEPELQHIQQFIQRHFDNSLVAKKLGVSCCSRRSIRRRKCRFGKRGHFKMRNRRKLFNSCLMNKYRDGNDSIKPHRDSEEIFGENPVVVILSIGATRTITFRRIIYDQDNLHLIQPVIDANDSRERSVDLPEGSILVMGGAVQKYYSHEISKDRTISSCHPHDMCHDKYTRYSLTFRNFK